MELDFLDLCHDDPLSDLIEYISALGTLSTRGRVMIRKGQMHGVAKGDITGQIAFIAGLFGVAA